MAIFGTTITRHDIRNYKKKNEPSLPTKASVPPTTTIVVVHNQN